MTESEEDVLLAKAVRKGRRQAVKILLARGVNSNKKRGLLHLAVKYGRVKILRLLLDAGCVRFKDSEGRSPFYFLFESGKKDKYVKICQLLLAKGANFSRTPMLLHYAVDHECFDLCKWLLDNEVVGVNKTGKWNATPLHHTVEYPYVERVSGEERGRIARLLLENGANIMAQDDYGATALDRAVKYKCLEVVIVLLEFKRDLPARELGIKTSLYYAIIWKRDDVVEQLRQNRAEVDTFEQQDAVTMLLEYPCSLYAVKWLVQFDVDLNAQNESGSTALHSAIAGAFHEVVAVLLKNDCDVNIQNRSKKTPLSINYEPADALRNVVVYHVLKLRAAGISISRTNKHLLRKFWLVNDDKYNEFKAGCKEEVKKMKERELGRLRLIDVIVKPRTFALNANESVISDFESVDLQEFPIYEGLIRIKYKKMNETYSFLKWIRVLNKTHSVLHQVEVCNLPPEVWRMIISYLDKKDVRRLIKCGEALKRQLC